MVECLRSPETTGRTPEIGGADVLSYQELMSIMAEELQLPPRYSPPFAESVVATAGTRETFYGEFAVGWIRWWVVRDSVEAVGTGKT